MVMVCVFRWLLQLNQYGVSLLRNVPTKDQQILKVRSIVVHTHTHTHTHTQQW